MSTFKWYVWKVISKIIITEQIPLILPSRWGLGKFRIFGTYALAANRKIKKNSSQELGLGSHRLEKYLNLEGFLEKSLKIKSALKSTGKSLKSLEKSLNFTIFCRT